MTALDDALFYSDTPPITVTATFGSGTLADVVFDAENTGFSTETATFGGGELRAISFDGLNVTTNCPAGGAIYPVFDGSDAIEGNGGDT
jgi:hypothetical protein